MTKNFPRVPLRELLIPVSRPESVDTEKEYRILGAHWYAKGLYVKDIKSGSEIQANKVYRVEKGDFVYNRLFAWKGSFAVATDENHSCYVSNEFPCFKVNPERIDAQYLWHYFSRAVVWEEALGLSTGGTPTSRNRLKEEKLLAMQIPLPPLPEQRRIVVKIEELAAKIEEACRLRQQVMKETEALLCAEMTKFFNNEQKKWTVLPIRESPIELNRETRNPANTNPNDEFQYLDISNVEGGTGRILNTQILLGRDAPSRARRVIRQDDIVMSTVRPNLKSFTIIPSELDNQICSTGFAVFSCHTDIEPKFLLYQMFSNYFVDQCTESMKGGHYPAINERNLLRVNLILPPISEQRKIVAYLDSIQAKADHLKYLQAEIEAELDALLPSILDKAFRGKL